MPTKFKLDNLERSEAQLLMLALIELRRKIPVGSKNEMPANNLIVRLQSMLTLS